LRGKHQIQHKPVMAALAVQEAEVVAEQVVQQARCKRLGISMFPRRRRGSDSRHYMPVT
jgi:hypothetical protein